MLYWIFDLDYTLYNVDKKIPLRYDYIKEDKYTLFLLRSLPFNKLIFTNGTQEHAQTCLSLMNMSSLFTYVIARDTIQDLKPNVSAYLKFMEISKLSVDDKCIFFEDSLDNLKQAKDIGWYTVYIGKLDRYIPYIDMVFININDALEFFVKKINSANLSN